MRKKFFLPLALVVIAAALFTVPAVAQQEAQPVPVAQFLEVSPVKQDFTVAADTSVQRVVTITNRHIAPIALRPAFGNMVVTSDVGDVNTTDEPTPWDLKRYATINSGDFTLQPRESKQVTVTISMPNNVSPGGYYGVLRFIPTQRTDLPPVAIQGEIGSLFLVRVPGPTTEAGSIKSFNATNTEGKKVGGLFFGNSMYLVTQIHNDGNVHFGTAPSFSVKNIFGKTVHQDSTTAQNVFPQGNRRFESFWGGSDKLWPDGNGPGTGYYTAKVTTNLPNQQGATQTIHFVVITPRFLALLAVVLLLVLGGWLYWRKRDTGKVA